MYYKEDTTKNLCVMLLNQKSKQLVKNKINFVSLECPVQGLKMRT